LTDALDGAGVTGYTILPVMGGSGRSGRWSREGQVSRAGGMVAIICIIRPDRLDALLEAAFTRGRTAYRRHLRQRLLRAARRTVLNAAAGNGFSLRADLHYM
jgi:hypothetical protein